MATIAPEKSPDRVLELARSVRQPFTVGTLVGASERGGVPISQTLLWLREAEQTGAVRDTGERRGSHTALRGSRLYSLT